MKTVASAPSRPAASATPWAWLPALAATTPRARSAVGQPGDPQVGAADLVRAGALQVLALEPGRRRPAIAVSGRLGSSGVFRITPASTFRAACDVLQGHQLRCWRRHAPIVARSPGQVDATRDPRFHHISLPTRAA